MSKDLWIDGLTPIYDYDNQAWTELRNGRRVYVRCGHPEEMECDCYGRIHAGETAKMESVRITLPPRK